MNDMADPQSNRRVRLGTGILRNRLSITDAVDRARAELELTSYRLIELRRVGLPGLPCRPQAGGQRGR